MIKSLSPTPSTAAHGKTAVRFNRFFSQDVAAKVTFKIVRMQPQFHPSFFWRLRHLCGMLDPIRRALAKAEIPAESELA